MILENEEKRGKEAIDKNKLNCSALKVNPR